MIIKYQPYKLLHNQLHPICSMSFKSEQEAINYAHKRGLIDSEIYIKKLYFEEEYTLEF